ncbi:MAG TPA: hypothetical protein VI733_05305 [Candidatus Limnocylindria bacterium]|nr:hypothetical protein [Candidatus Limnocylindria bacterium]
MILVVAVSPVVVVEALARDATPPAELAAPLDNAKRILVGRFDLIPLVQRVRYVDSEYRPTDDLVFLYFEIRSYPYLWSREVFLVSRCVPLADFAADTFAGMGGGYVQSSRASDPELVHLRGPDQPTC